MQSGSARRRAQGRRTDLYVFRKVDPHSLDLQANLRGARGKGKRRGPGGPSGDGGGDGRLGPELREEKSSDLGIAP